MTAWLHTRLQALMPGLDPSQVQALANLAERREIGKGGPLPDGRSAVRVG